MPKRDCKEDYSFPNYCQLERWCSYWYQISEIVKLRPESILEIGVGDKVVGMYLKENFAIDYKSVDNNADLKPDMTGSIDSLPCADGSFNLVCAFEVVEHLPFEKFPKALAEMRRVARRHVILSIPHWGRHVSLALRLPYFKKISIQKKFSFRPLEHKYNGEHYWEIGKKGYSLDTVAKTIRNAGFKIMSDYIMPESPYHHMFIMEKI